MQQINMFEAKSSLSRLVQALEDGTESEFVIARHGRPAARLVPLNQGGNTRRIGVAKGCFVVPASIDQNNTEIARLFDGDAS